MTRHNRCNMNPVERDVFGVLLLSESKLIKPSVSFDGTYLRITFCSVKGKMKVTRWFLTVRNNNGIKNAGGECFDIYTPHFNKNGEIYEIVLKIKEKERG